MKKKKYIYIFVNILSKNLVKRNPLFLHEIEWKNNGFLFTTPNISVHIYIYICTDILGVVKRNPLFFHSISCKNNGFLFTKFLLNIFTNIYIYFFFFIF